MLLVRPGRRCVFYTDFRYLEAAAEQLRFLRVEKLAKPADQLGPLVKRERWTRVGYEGALPGARPDMMRE